MDYATRKNLYVSIDYHHIDNASSRASAADAVTFWTDIAPRFAGVSNVIFEPFNEPIDANVGWSSLQAAVDGNGASWTAWVTDNAWTPSMFADANLSTLTNLGTVAKSWLAATADRDWVQ